jgi:serine/threonine protein phosphatase PrpC
VSFGASLEGPSDPEREKRPGEIEPADGFLLCSDRLIGHLSDEEIAAMTTGCRWFTACRR